ncbi:type VI secretion system protein TssA [Pantoea anthophila]|uniref:Type VI secretion system protein TssA n=1 Tax=Pantoea anthophila TaxID=470931 RepID=A0ABY2Z5L0_9GAMM|nr:type VI secretion system protein TssA [Pantoea anthophila]TPV24282.1 type VI secretion system protein TssA [Pantoea anthophila]WIM55684.1 type VI secretion system protein TssA [Pantoea anthophila]
MTTNIEALLAPVSDDNPGGDNLEYHADFLAMEQASAGKAEQQFGSTIIPAEPADWNKVEKLAIALLERSKDLRVMLALTHAWTELKGLPGYAQGLKLIEQALLLYWEPLWPRLEEYGEQDPFYRINALALLGDKSPLSSAVRQSWLLRYPSDGITLRDAAALCDGSKTEVADYPGGLPRLIDELARGDQPGIEAVLQIHERLQTICETVAERLGDAAVPELTQLRRQIALIAERGEATDLSALVPTAAATEQPAETAAAPAPAAPRAATDWRSVQIGSRADAQLMLEKVKLYFTQHEPSHPAPLMIDRVQRLIERDFLEIIRELAPDGVHQLETIFGRRD